MDKCYEFAKQICTDELIDDKLSQINFNIFMCVTVVVITVSIVIISEYILHFKDKIDSQR